MCAELCEALEPFNCLPKDYVAEWLQHKEGLREDLNFTVARAAFTKARKLLEEE
jgi:hypothetical protein